jgi:hypothetical protein
MSAVVEEVQPEEIQDRSKPKPYPVNKPSYKVQDSFSEDDSKYVLTVEYKRLDSQNFRLLLEKEKNTKRITETLTKNRSRERLNVDDAHDQFFDAIAIQGWLKENDGEDEKLEYRALTELTIERKIALNVKFLDCKAIVKHTVGAGKHDFLFERDGHMIIEFLIGDPDFPLWKLLMKVKRPKQSKRSKFRDDFAYGITSRGGDLPITETYIDLSSGVRLFDEFFDTIINDGNYSEVAFLQNNPEKSVLDHNYVEGDETDRKAFLGFFNPHFKVEVAGAVIATFSKSGRD